MRPTTIKRHNLVRQEANKQAFLAQRDTAGGIKTFNAWYWKQEGDAYDANH